MDLLSQYKQQHPEAFREQKKKSPVTDEYGRVYTGMIALVMRLSGGRIRDVRRANMILFGSTFAILILSGIIFFTQGDKEIRPPPGYFVYPPGFTK